MTNNDKQAMYRRIAEEAGYNLPAFINFHEILDVLNFDWHELLVNCEKEGNTLPPYGYWENIRTTIRIAQRIREELETPISISSAYRSETYNRLPGIDGSARSRHLFFNALDLQSVLDPKRLAACALELRKRGEFKGGVGLYKWGIHIDARGSNATWGFVDA